MYITGYAFDPSSKTLYLFRDNEQVHFDTKDGLNSEEDALAYVAELNKIGDPRIAPTPAPIAPAPIAPAPTPTITTNPAVEEIELFNEISNDLPNDLPSFEEPIEETQDIPGEIISATEIVTEEPGVSLAALQAERAGHRAGILKDLGFQTNEQGYYGYGFNYSFALLNNHTDEYFNAFVQEVEKAIANVKEENLAIATEVANREPKFLSTEVSAISTEPTSVVEEIVVQESPIVEHGDKVLAEEAQDDLTENNIVKIIEEEEGKEMAFEMPKSQTLAGDELSKFFAMLSGYEVTFGVDAKIGNYIGFKPKDVTKPEVKTDKPKKAPRATKNKNVVEQLVTPEVSKEDTSGHVPMEL